jgi:hypothetical protein
VTADPAVHPQSLRAHLRELQAALDESASLQAEHLGTCGCRGTCTEARRLARIVAGAEFQLQMTRFLNEAD